MGSAGDRRRALTLLEVLVVMGIMSVAAGLLVAAAQQARSAANAMICGNNLHQIGVGLHAFHDVQGLFPHSGGLPPGGNRPPTPTIATGVKRWGVGAPRYVQRLQPGPWTYSILPFIEQSEVYERQDYAAAVRIYMCPARGRENPQVVPTQDPVFPRATYSSGGVSAWGKTDYAGNVYVVLGDLALNNDPRGPKLTGRTERIADITDGLSNTIVIGEKSIDTRAYNTGGWYWDEPIFAGGGAGGTVRGGTVVLRDAEAIAFSNNWGAAPSWLCAVSIRRWRGPQDRIWIRAESDEGSSLSCRRGSRAGVLGDGCRNVCTAVSPDMLYA
jgi:prepilin-type N-terminal cleavage/methylation domain-containing protein